MVKDFITLKMAINIRDNMLMGNEMAMVNIATVMDAYFKGSGRIIKNMVKANISFQITLIIKDFLKTPLNLA